MSHFAIVLEESMILSGKLNTNRTNRIHLDEEKKGRQHRVRDKG